jgi:hypothetical protein
VLAQHTGTPGPQHELLFSQKQAAKEQPVQFRQWTASQVGQDALHVAQLLHKAYLGEFKCSPTSKTPMLVMLGMYLHVVTTSGFSGRCHVYVLPSAHSPERQHADLASAAPPLHAPAVPQSLGSTTP